MGGPWFCAKIMCFTVPIVPVQSPTLVQRFLVNITVAFLAKYIVGSQPPMSSALIYFALGLVWYALICTMGSASCFSLVKVICCNFFISKWQFYSRGFKFCDVVDILRCSWQSKCQSSRLEFPTSCLCLKVAKLLLCNVAICSTNS